MHLLLLTILLVVCVAAPLGYAWRLWRLDRPSRGGWLVTALEATFFVALVFLVGRWDIAGHYTRLVLAVVFTAALIASGWRHASRPWRSPDEPAFWRRDGQMLVSAGLFGAALVYVSSGLAPAPDALRLAFPLRGGAFMVAHGGGVQLINHHADHRAQRWATDITALNRAGTRAAGLLPKQLQAYAVYGAEVVSPCAGKVLRARDDLPDLIPPKADRANAIGNHAVVRCGGANVEMAHLQPGSLRVRAGDDIGAGEPIGRVGNTGNTSEPHLHIHAVDPETGAGLPISFDGRAPLRNGLFRR